MKDFINGFRKGYRAQMKHQAAKYDMTPKEYHALNVVGWLLILIVGTLFFRRSRR